MRRKFTGTMRDGSGIDPRRVVVGLPYSKFFRFNADPGNGGDGGAGGGAGNSDADKSKGSGDADGKPDPAKLLAELEETRKALKLANKEAGDHRKKLETFEQAEKEKADKEKSELTKAQERAAAAEEKLNRLESALVERDISDAIRDEARAAGFRDVADALQFVDRSVLEVKDGKVNGAKEAVAAVAKAKPYLLASADDKDKGKKGNGTPPPDQKKKPAPAGDRETNVVGNPRARL